MKKIISLLSFFIAFNFIIFSQSHTSTQSHQDIITNIVPFTTSTSSDVAFLSAGDDGYIVKWTDDDQGEHYQVTDVGIKLAAVSPNGNYVALYETDGGSINKVSVWDWKTFTRKYQKKFTDSITALNFSSKGNYLIIGTATVDGAIFVRTNNWQIVDKIKSNTNIVNYITTSDTEKTVAMYSPSGLLSYYNMQNGQLKQKFSVIQGLSQVLLFNNNIFLAGMRDNNIYITNAYKGNTVASVPVNNGIIISTSKEKDLYYLEYDGKNNYTLKMLETIDNNQISNPRIVKTFKGPRSDSAIVKGCKIHDQILLGSRTGSIYRIDSEPSITTYNMEEITDNIYSKIYDIAAENNDFYFLTENSIYKSSYDSGIVDKLTSTNGENKIISYDDNAILCSLSTRYPVRKYNFTTKEYSTLFTPSSNIQTLKLFEVKGNHYLLDIESNSDVQIYDLQTQQLKLIYSGTGIQDAVLADDGKVYIGKSASTNPKSPLICVDIETQETVPLPVNGNVSFGLSIIDNLIYGINLQTNEGITSTYVYSYNIKTKQVVNILKFTEEDSDAFTYLYENNLYTNIGKNKVYCYNLKTKKRFSYNRTASIPTKICQNSNRVVILNRDGSISWCSGNNQNLLADWYMTKDGQWYEF